MGGGVSGWGGRGEERGAALTGGVGGDFEAVELRGFDEAADGGEDAEAHEETEDDLEPELDLQVVNDEDGVQGEQEVGGCAPGCGVRWLVTGLRSGTAVGDVPPVISAQMIPRLMPEQSAPSAMFHRPAVGVHWVKMRGTVTM